MSPLPQDLLFALRRLRKNPGFTVVAVLILALGLGATTALFSVVHGVLLTPLPYPDADRIYRVQEFEQPTRTAEGSVSVPTFEAWREGLDSLDSLTAVYFDNFNLTGAREPQQMRVARVHPDFFPIFGPRPRPGRAFTDDETRGAGADVILLAHGLWQRQFGGQDDLLGQAIELDGRPYTVVGIMPAGFEFPDWADGWMPLGDRAGSDRATRNLAVYGRLAPGSDEDAASAELEVMAERLRTSYPETHAEIGAELLPLLEEEVGDARQTLWLLFAAVGGVLMIICLNVAGLQLARGLEQRRELALRSALGAGRRRVIQQLMTESLLLACFGGGLGLLLAHWIFDLLLTFAPAGTPRLDEVTLGSPVLAFGLGVTLLTGFLAGWLPALSATRFDLDEALKSGARSQASGRGTGLRRALVVAQVTLTLVLLATAGLILGSLYRWLQSDLGYDVDQVLSVGLVLPPNLYAEGHQKMAFVDQVRERLEAHPDIDRVAVGNSLPWAGFPGRPLNLQPLAARTTDGLQGFEKAVSDGYFETLGARLLAGRTPGPEDRSHAEGTGVEGMEYVVINETLARRGWPELGRLPLGEVLEIAVPGQPPTRAEILGVVADLRTDHPDAPVELQVFRAFEDSPWNYFNIAVRSAGGDTGALHEVIRQAVWEVDPDRPLFSDITATGIFDQQIAGPRFEATLLGGFALLALLLSAVGLYGLMAFVVGQRGREIGIRMALGARRQQVRWMVMRQGLTLVGAGLVLGVPAVLLTRELAKGLLVEIESGSPLLFAAASTVLLLAAILAIHLPAKRASQTHPVEALRNE